MSELPGQIPDLQMDNQPSAVKKWFWMMDYCQERQQSPAWLWAWKEAGEAYEKSK